MPEIFTKTKVHVTNFSGCTLEAVNFGIPSIIIDKRGLDAFKDIIAEKKAFYTTNKAEFDNQLAILLKKSIPIKSNIKNETYKEVLKKLN